MPLLESWPVLAVTGAALVGYGELRARVSTLRKDVDEKAPREVVEAQYHEIIARLDRMERHANGAQSK